MEGSSRESLRILIVHSFYRVAGGEDRYVTQQIGLLQDRHDVELVSRDNKELHEGVSVAARMIGSRAELQGMEHVVDRFRPDVIHLHNAYPSFGPAVHLAARACNIPLVMTVHNFRLRCPNSFMFTEGRPCRRCERGNYANAVLHHCFPSRAQAAGYATALWMHRFVLRLERLVDLFLTVNRFSYDRLLGWGLPHQRVELVRLFTEVPRSSSAPGRFGTYLGRVSPEKGLDVLVEALRRAGDPPFRIIGDGPTLDATARRIAEVGLTRTELVGRVSHEEAMELLGDARYVVFPSLWDENAPLAALEAMALGRPLLVTDTGGLPELVENGEGLVSPPGDVDDLAANLRKLSGDYDLCVDIGARARALIDAAYTPQAHLERLEGLYRRVLTR